MKDIIKNGAEQMGIMLDDKQIGQFLEYARLLKEWNEKINLTAITDDEGIAIKHFLDSMSAITTKHVNGKVIDVGTGAGFPGLVLKIANPQISLTLLDSLNKRLTVLKDITSKISVNDIEFVHARAEDGGQNAMYREKFDTVVSRAVANMTRLCEWCLPFVKVGGYFLALKGPAAYEELEEAKRMISMLGGEVECVSEIQIPFSKLKHCIIIVKKVRQTPMRFPQKKGIKTKNCGGNCYNLKK